MDGSNEENRADKLAHTIQRVGKAGGAFRLIKTAGFSALLLILAFVIYRWGLPWYISAAMAFMAVAIIVLDVISLKRISAVDLNSFNEPIPDEIALDEGEILFASIPAVMEYGKIRSYGVLGAGKVLLPDNALLITNTSLWTLTVPVAGADKVVSDTDIGQWQWTVAYQSIIDRLNEMTAELPLEELLKQCRAKRLMRLSELQSVKTLPHTHALSFKRADGKKFGYSVRLKEDYDRAKAVFHME